MPGQVQPKHADRPGGRGDQPQQHLDRGGFAGPVRTQEAKDLPGMDLERHPVHGGELTKPLREASDFDDRIGHRRAREVIS